MGTNEIGAFGYAIALIVYALRTILLLSGWRRSDQSRLPALATGISVVWAGVWMAGFLYLTRAYALVTLLEWARGLAWLVASLAILREIAQTHVTSRLRFDYGIFVLLLAVIPAVTIITGTTTTSENILWH